jgi:hypothetical protein
MIANVVRRLLVSAFRAGPDLRAPTSFRSRAARPFKRMAELPDLRSAVGHTDERTV